MKTRIANGMVVFSATPTYAEEAVRTITFDPRKVDLNLRNYAECLGWLNRIKDNAAITAKAIVVTDDMRLNAVQELVSYYESGATSWSRAANDMPRAPVQSAWILEIANRFGETYAQAEMRVQAMVLNGLKDTEESGAATEE